MEKYTITSFRAIDNLELSTAFYNGHTKVITDLGITNLNTALPAWIYDDNVFVAVVQDEFEEVIAGLRVHKYVEGNDIPLISALNDIDPRIVDVFNSHGTNNTAEICGLWSARKAITKGLGNLLCITSVAMVKLVGLNNFYCFAAPYTEKMIKANGCINVSEIGDDGKFNYPTPEFISIVLRNPDIDKLEFADNHNYERIKSLIDYPDQIYIEKAPRQDIEVKYCLSGIRVWQ